MNPWLGRSPGEGNGNPHQHSCLENPHEQRNLVSYSPWGHKESDGTEQLNTQHFVVIISQYIQISNHHVMCLKQIYFDHYILIIPQ